MFSLLPNELILRTDLTLIERAIIPVIMARTCGWATRTNGVSMPDIMAVIGGDIKQVQEGIGLLEAKGIIQSNRFRDKEANMVLYGLHASLVEHINSPAAAALPVPASPAPAALSNHFIDMPNSTYTELKQDALDLMVKAGYHDPASIFDDYEDECRSENPSSMDWKAHFRIWLRRKSFRKTDRPVNSKYIALPAAMKPDPHQFRAAQYFHHKHKEINKAHPEPNNMQYEGYQIKLIIDTSSYELNDVIRAIDWLFSKAGDWFRPNVQTCDKLREKMDFIAAHLVSYADAKTSMAEHPNILDLLEKSQ